MNLAPPLTSSGLQAPIEVASMFYTGINEPRPTAMDFSFDGLHFASAHTDDAVRLIDVGGLHHNDTIVCDAFGVHNVRYTHSSAVVCVVPRFHLDGHLHLLNTETAQFFGEMAYLNDVEAEIPAVANTPVYSTLTQCPVTDVLGSVVAAKGRFALFHPLISGCVAATAERTVVGPKPCVQFSSDGNAIALGDDHRVVVLDRRRLFDSAVVQRDTKQLFSSYSPLTRCKGVEFSADGSHLLVTSSNGEVVLYDWKREEVTVNYFHGDARRHFVGAGDAIGARFAFPGQPTSPILQPTSFMCGGRHLLVYDGNWSLTASPHPSETPRETQQGRLLYELQSKDSDVPVAVAVNPRYQVAATAARSITWWAFHQGIMEAQSKELLRPSP
jgi:WD40 repeat protein